MPVVNKRSTYCTRTCVQIFIRTPCCKINIPVMEVQRDITSGMCQVKSGNSSNFVGCICDGLHIEQLPGIIIYSTNHDQGQFTAMLFDSSYYFFCSVSDFTSSRFQFDECILGVK